MKQELYKDLLDVVKTYFDEEDLNLLNTYYEYANKLYDKMKRLDGEDYINHSIRVALVLAPLKMDITTIGSALIHEALLIDENNQEEVLSLFGEETVQILESIKKISHLKRTFTKEKNDIRYRRIIVGLSENPSSLFIKLADRLDNLKTLYVHDEKHQKEIIDETENIYIPIAHRLGIKKIKGDLEDLCLRNSHPKEYEEVLKKINTSREELENDLLEMKNEIVSLLNEYNIKFEILSRVKSVTGIYKKLAIGRSWSDIYDLLGIRILVKKVEECYLVIGLIHSKYQSIPKRFKDFIANPKSNMYQSVHTTVFGYNNKMYEIQVRTFEMDEIAESGVASHWSYKEHISGKKTALDERLEMFKTLIEVNDNEDNMNFFKYLNQELNKEEIYVFTPKGDVIELPIDSTPIDFAYKIHSEIGNDVISAYVNNKLVKLDFKLHDGDIVNLNVQKGKGPNKSWLKSVKTDLAKNKIKSYFYKKDKEKLIDLGKDLVLNEFKRRKIDENVLEETENLNSALEELNIDSLEDAYFDIATLKITPNLFANKFVKKESKIDETINKVLNSNKVSKSENQILVSGEDDILTSIASCCSPVFGEEIIGYVTKGNGVTVHKKSCPYIPTNNERIIDVSWNTKNHDKYLTYLNIIIENEKNNLIEVITLANKLNINIESMRFLPDAKENICEVACKVNDIDNLNKYISNLEKFDFITKIERK